MSEFYIIIVQKIFAPFFLGGGHVPPPLPRPSPTHPVSYAYAKNVILPLEMAPPFQQMWSALNKTTMYKANTNPRPRPSKATALILDVNMRLRHTCLVILPLARSTHGISPSPAKTVLESPPETRPAQKMCIFSVGSSASTMRCSSDVLGNRCGGRDRIERVKSSCSFLYGRRSSLLCIRLAASRTSKQTENADLRRMTISRRRHPQFISVGLLDGLHSGAEWSRRQLSKHSGAARYANSAVT